MVPVRLAPRQLRAAEGSLHPSLVNLMQRIRKRPRLDKLLNQQRSVEIAWGRRLYLALLCGFALALLNYFVGDALELRADGIILTDRQIVAATYPAKVSAVYVKEGEIVPRGALLVELQSADMLKDIADLSLRNADLAARETQLRVTAASVQSLLPLAQRNAREGSDALARIDTLSDRGLVSIQSMTQALSSGYDAAAKLADLRGQAEILGDQLTLVEQSHRRAGEALAQLEAFYDRGAVRAVADGAVGSHVPVIGQVVKFGDELLQVYGDNAYILAYLPDIYWFAVSPGDIVEVSGGMGSRSSVGTVEEILGVADALPPEFQNAFRPRDRSRLVRIRLPAGHGFAISQKVRIGGCALGWCWRSRASG
jgi:multidrug resistance efflux pump